MQAVREAQARVVLADELLHGAESRTGEPLEIAVIYLEVTNTVAKSHRGRGPLAVSRFGVMGCKLREPEQKNIDPAIDPEKEECYRTTGRGEPKCQKKQ